MQKDAKITIRIKEKDKELLREIAEEQDVPMSLLIREAIKKLIKEGGAND